MHILKFGSFNLRMIERGLYLTGRRSLCASVQPAWTVLGNFHSRIQPHTDTASVLLHGKCLDTATLR